MFTGDSARGAITFAGRLAVVAALIVFPAELVAQSSPSLTVAPTTVAPGATVTVTVANGPGNARDWVAMYSEGAADGSYLNNWQYLNGSKTPPSSGVTSATLTFALPFATGNYNLRFFANDSMTKLATSATITVTTGGAPPSVTVTPTTVSPGGTVTVTVANGPGNALDWVASYLTGSPDSSYIEWQYLNGSRTPP